MSFVLYSLPYLVLVQALCCKVFAVVRYLSLARFICQLLPFSFPGFKLSRVLSSKNAFEGMAPSVFLPVLYRVTEPRTVLEGGMNHGHIPSFRKRLRRLAGQCQYRLPGRKFRDPPELKQLCRLRNRTPDHSASLSRHIITTRRAERHQWLSDLYVAASSGDSSAIAFLKQRRKPTSTWSHLITHYGSQPAATHHVQEHFHQLFANTPLHTRATDCAPHLQTIEAHMANIEPHPIQADEVHQAVAQLKPGKTSGDSGMSNEFLLAFSRAEAGLTLLLHMLNTMFVDEQLHPELLLASACLIPKSANITLASQIRQILLLEVLQKFYASILMRRLAPHWPPLTAHRCGFCMTSPLEILRFSLPLCCTAPQGCQTVLQVVMGACILHG